MKLNDQIAMPAFQIFLCVLICLFEMCSALYVPESEDNHLKVLNDNLDNVENSVGGKLRNEFTHENLVSGDDYIEELELEELFNNLSEDEAEILIGYFNQVKEQQMRTLFKPRFKCPLGQILDFRGQCVDEF